MDTKTPSKSDFGPHLLLLRAGHELSLRAAASECGITASYLSDIENNRRTPSIRVIQKLAVLYDVKSSDLATRACVLSTWASHVLKNNPEFVARVERVAFESQYFHS